MNTTHRFKTLVLYDGVHYLLVGHEAPPGREVVSRPVHLGETGSHGGEGKLVEVFKDVIMEIRGDTSETGSFHGLTTAVELDQTEGGSQGRHRFYNKRDLKNSAQWVDEVNNQYEAMTSRHRSF